MSKNICLCIKSIVELSSNKITASKSTTFTTNRML